MKLMFALLSMLFTVSQVKASEKKVVCYWNSFSNRNVGLKGMSEVKDIDPNICTHIIFAYVRFTLSIIVFPDFNEDDLTQFLNLKSQNPNVKLLVGIGGPRQGTQIPSTIASTPTGRLELSQKVKKFIDDNKFDGCDFDWQWPGQGAGSSINDKYNYILLLQSMRSALTYSKIFSISVASKPEDIETSYDIPKIVQYVDFINLNTFDFHGVGNFTVTALHSAYRKAPNDLINEAEWNAKSVIENWISHGAPANMLTLGIPTYGRSFTLSDVRQTEVGAPANKTGLQSEYLAENSNIIPYAQICINILTNPRWISYWNKKQFAPYAVFNANQWVGYDDLQVVKAKIHLALERDLGGLNYATIDRDDFTGECGAGKFPLVRIGYQAIINGVIPENPLNPSTVSETVTVPITTTTETTTTTTPSLPCLTANGMFRHPYDCTKFLLFLNWIQFVLQCPDGLYFDAIYSRCDYPSAVECNF